LDFFADILGKCLKELTWAFGDFFPDGVGDSGIVCGGLYFVGRGQRNRKGDADEDFLRPVSLLFCDTDMAPNFKIPDFDGHGLLVHLAGDGGSEGWC